MSMSLPEKPSLEHLKNQAKSILKSHKNKETSCCKVLRNLTDLKTKPDKEILEIPLTLQKVQFALAIDYGFKSWQELKKFIEVNHPPKSRKIEDLKMTPFNATQMGVLKGVADFYKIKISESMLYGLTGHAFVINIHEQICPSGPYVWNQSKFYQLLKNIGIRCVNLGFFTNNNPLKDRTQVEKKLCKVLDSGNPCSLTNMEHQLISGYNDKNFILEQPWGPKCAAADITPSKLTFENWQEFKDEIHACFYVYSKVKSSDLKKSIIESLNFAIDMFANPQNYSFEYYGIGPEAYSNWINAAKEFGATHGNWWNAMVWAECRSMASKYFSKIGKIFTNVNELTFKLEKIYESISCNLIKISDTSMKFDDKIALLKKTLTEEHNAIEKIYYLKNRLIK